MKKLIILAILTVTMVGCANAGSGAIGGTAAGAGAGALIGNAIGHNTKSTLIGAAAGTALGAVVGTAQDRNRIEQEKVNQQYYNQQAPQGYYPMTPQRQY